MRPQDALPRGALRGLRAGRLRGLRDLHPRDLLGLPRLAGQEARSDLPRSWSYRGGFRGRDRYQEEGQAPDRKAVCPDVAAPQESGKARSFAGLASPEKKFLNIEYMIVYVCL